ncbi:MAG: hypothetical protein AAF829_02075 [Pseudomonadota bacterium]
MAENTAQGEWSVSRRQSLVRERVEIDLRMVGLLFALSIVAALLRPPYAYSIDDVIYVEMARAFWENGVLFISGRGGVAGAPELVLNLTHGIEGRVYPQYPALYGILAAPFYGLAGVRGLVFLNAIGFFAVLWLTLRSVGHLYGLALDRRFVAGLLAFATFMPAYAMGIWPHMFALALVMAAIERATAHLSLKERPDPLSLVLAGLWMGAAIAIRVDSVMPAIAVVFWLALFGAPTVRSAPLWFLFGALPFLFLASALNGEKFGTYIPISYGPKVGPDGIGAYTVHLVVVGVVLALACWINPGASRAKAVLSRFKSPLFLVPLLLAGLTLAVLVEPLRKVFWNAYVLVADLQQLDEWQLDGAVRRDADGYIHVVGVYNRALLQSAPFLVLAAIALTGLASGRRVVARSLCVLVAGSVIGFYSLNQYHGHYSHNMRYFLAALPFLVILSVDGFTSLCRGVGTRLRRISLMHGVAIGAIVFAVLWLSPLPKPFTTFYPPLFAAAALLFTSLIVALVNTSSLVKRIWLTTTGVAIGLSIVASWADVVGQNQSAGREGPITEAAANTLPAGALLVTSIEEHFLTAPKAGIHMVSAVREDGQVARAAIAAFRADGRCVYVHTPRTLEWLTIEGDWSSVMLPGLSGTGATMMQPSHQSARCALTAPR